MKKVSLIASIASGTRAIGNNNELLFRISDDLKRFKQLTTGHPVVMGRKTWESIGKALPNRTNIVISRDPQYPALGATVVNSLESALALAADPSTPGNEEIFILGGGQVYAEAFPLADYIYLTLVHSDKMGDTFFPEYEGYTIAEHSEEHVDEKSGLKYHFINLRVLKK